MSKGAEVATHSDTANENRIQEKSRMDPEGLSEDELRILKTIRARQMLRTEDSMSIDSFTSDSLNGYSPLVQTGKLTLVKAGPRAEPKIPKMDNSGRFFDANAGKAGGSDGLFAGVEEGVKV